MLVTGTYVCEICPANEPESEQLSSTVRVAEVLPGHVEVNTTRHMER